METSKLTNPVKIPPKVVVTTVIKDEAWMMPDFLESCSKYADHILIYDESSGLDNTRSFYSQFPKVEVIYNNGAPVRYDIKRKHTFYEARKRYPGPILIVPLDGDEILSDNLHSSEEWQEVLKQPPATLIHLQWVNLWMDHTHYKVDHAENAGNYNRTLWMDDGTSEIPDVGEKGFHMVYTPLQAKKEIYLKEIVCLHYQFCNWNRMESKHRYYRIQEKADLKKLSDLAIFRIYGHYKSQTPQTRPSDPKWFQNFSSIAIEERAKSADQITYYDLIVMETLKKLGANRFTNLDIWENDWAQTARTAAARTGRPLSDFTFELPKNRFRNQLFWFYVKLTLNLKWLHTLERKIFRKTFNYNVKPILEVIREKVFTNSQ